MLINEALTKSSHSADFLAADLLEAANAANAENPVLGIMLRDLIADAVKIQHRLLEIESVLVGEPERLAAKDAE